MLLTFYSRTQLLRPKTSTHPTSHFVIEDTIIANRRRLIQLVVESVTTVINVTKQGTDEQHPRTTEGIHTVRAILKQTFLLQKHRILGCENKSRFSPCHRGCSGRWRHRPARIGSIATAVIDVVIETHSERRRAQVEDWHRGAKRRRVNRSLQTNSRTQTNLVNIGTYTTHIPMLKNNNRHVKSLYVSSTDVFRHYALITLHPKQCVVPIQSNRTADTHSILSIVMDVDADQQLNMLVERNGRL